MADFQKALEVASSVAGLHGGRVIRQSSIYGDWEPLTSTTEVTVLFQGPSIPEIQARKAAAAESLLAQLGPEFKAYHVARGKYRVLRHNYSHDGRWSGDYVVGFRVVAQ